MMISISAPNISLGSRTIFELEEKSMAKQGGQRRRCWEWIELSSGMNGYWERYDGKQILGLGLRENPLRLVEMPSFLVWSLNFPSEYIARIQVGFTEDPELTGAELCAHRLRLGLTQQEMKEVIGIKDIEMLRLWEQGIGHVPIGVSMRLQQIVEERNRLVEEIREVVNQSRDLLPALVVPMDMPVGSVVSRKVFAWVCAEVRACSGKPIRIVASAKDATVRGWQVIDIAHVLQAHRNADQRSKKLS